MPGQRSPSPNKRVRALSSERSPGSAYNRNRAVSAPPLDNAGDNPFMFNERHGPGIAESGSLVRKSSDLDGTKQPSGAAAARAARRVPSGVARALLAEHDENDKPSKPSLPPSGSMSPPTSGRGLRALAENDGDEDGYPAQKPSKPSLPPAWSDADLREKPAKPAPPPNLDFDDADLGVKPAKPAPPLLPSSSMSDVVDDTMDRGDGVRTPPRKPSKPAPPPDSPFETRSTPRD